MKYFLHRVLFSVLIVFNFLFVLINDVKAQFAFTPSNKEYHQNFNSFLGTLVSLPNHWVVTPSDEYLGIGCGSNNVGGVYAYSTSPSATERALGYLPSNAVSNFTAQVSFINNTGEEITSIEIEYDFETWRRLNSGRTNGFVVTSNIPGANLSGLNNVQASTGISNCTQISVNKSIVLSNLNIAVGQSFYIRWEGDRGISSGASNGIAIDNFKIKVCNSILNTIDTTICQGSTYSFNNNIYNTSQTGLTATFVSVDGCDSIVTLNLTVTPYLTGTFDTTICQGQSITFNGINYSVNTPASLGITDTINTNGCDSIVTLNLTVTPSITHTIDTTICQGQSVVFNGITYTNSQSGLTGTFQSIGGCDSIVTLNLSVTPYLTGTFDTTICQGQSITFNGINYSVSTPASMGITDTINTNGCDSIVTLNLTVTPSITHTIDTTICQGQSIVFNGITYSNSQSGLTGTFQSVGGCDSIVTLNLSVTPYLTGTFDTTICQGQSITFNGINYAVNTPASLGITDTINANGCDSIVTLNLTVTPSITHTIDTTICQGQSVVFNGITYTNSQSGLTGTFQSVGGCDSIVILNLTVTPYLTGTFDTTICQGQSITFNGINYSVSTPASLGITDTINTFGCDSIVTLNLTVNPYLTGTFDTTICQGQSITFNGINYSVSTPASLGITDTINTNNGCDSIVTLNLTVTPSITHTIDTIICQGQSVVFNGNTYTNSQSGLTGTFQSIGGCDSIVTLNLTVTPYLTGTFDTTICQGQSITFNGINYSVSTPVILGITDTINTNGCDSIVTLNLSVTPYLTGTFDTTICQGQSITFNGINYSVSTPASLGITDTININGCDSIVTLNLTVTPYLTGTFDTTICQGQSITFNGINYSVSTPASLSITDTINTNGCDSIVTLNLTVNPSITHTIDTIICQGQSIVFNGITYTNSQSGLTGTFQSIGGCDSIVTLNLSVTPYLTGTFDTTICQGQSITFNGINYSVGTPASLGITDTINTNGCDSIVTLNLTVTPSITHTIDTTICQGQSIVFNGITYSNSQSGLTVTFQSVGGCDSIVTLNLSVTPYLTGTFDTTICQGQSITFNGINYSVNTPASLGITDTINTNGCDSIITLNLTVTPSITHTIDTTICQGQSIVFNGFTYTNSQSGLTGTFQSVGGCDSIVTLNLTVTPYLTGTFDTTICQGQSITFNGINYSVSTPASLGITDTINTFGCDSIVTLNLSVTPYLTGTFDTTICQGQSITFNGINYTVNTPASLGITDTINTNGCDSIVILNLMVTPSITHTIDTTICQGQSIVFNGITYTNSQSGLTGTFQSIGGCDSIVTLNLNVTPYLTGTFDTTICQGQSITFNGINYSVSTPASMGITDTINTNGCDSIITLNLTVTPSITHTIDTTICQGQSIVFNGITYTNSQSGLTGTFQSVGGCDSIVTLNLNVTPYLTGTFDTTICQGQSITFNGINYSVSTPASLGITDTFNTNGCDSIVTLNLTVNPYLTGTFDTTICQGQSITFNGINYSVSTPASLGITDTININGCDSIVTLNLSVTPYLTGTFDTTICQGQSITFNGINYSVNTPASLGITDTINSNGCDSIVTLNLTVTPYLTGTFDTTICQGQSITFNGINYSVSTPASMGITDTINTNGCDSIVTLNLTVTPYLTGTFDTTICQGQSITFNGINYSVSTPASLGITDTINTNGCDSIVTLNLSVTPYLTGTFDTTICQGQSITFNGINYSVSTPASMGITDTINTNGCDSIVTLNLSVTPYLTGTFDTTICQGQSITFNGINYSVSTPASLGITDTINTNGCDSIVTLNLSVTPYLTGTFDTTICQGQSITFNGINYSLSTPASLGITDTINTNGCDSIVTLNLIVNPSITLTIDTSICQGQSVVFNGITYSNSQTGITATFQSAFGCDSTVILNLNVIPFNPIYQTNTIEACEYVNYDGINYYNDTLLTDTLFSQIGCDSVYLTVNIQINNTPVYNIYDKIFACDSILFNGELITESTILIDTLQSILGCDSVIINTQITIEKINLNLEIEPNDPYESEPFQITVSETNNHPFNVIRWLPLDIFTNSNTEKSQRISIQNSQNIGVIGSSPGGCLDTVNLLINPRMYQKVLALPNAFSPNGDGINDVFKPILLIDRAYSIIEFKIFNRYGQLIHSSANMASGWDGYFNGKLQDQGVYQYYIRVKFIDNTEKLIKGDLTLIK